MNVYYAGYKTGNVNNFLAARKLRALQDQQDSFDTSILKLTSSDHEVLDFSLFLPCTYVIRGVAV